MIIVLVFQSSYLDKLTQFSIGGASTSASYYLQAASVPFALTSRPHRRLSNRAFITFQRYIFCLSRPPACSHSCVFVCIFKHTDACTSHGCVCVKRMAGLCDFRALVNCRGSFAPAAGDPSVTLALINSFRCHHKASEPSHM